ERERRGVAERLQQSSPALPRLREIPLLDVTEAANLLGHSRDFDRERMVVRRKRRGELLQHGFVLADEAALGAALLRVAEHVERRAAQTPHAREDSEGAEYPGAIGALAQLPARRIARGEERRRQMKL